VLPLTVRFLDGSREGEELVFEDDIEMIVFGRDEAACQVLFGEDADEVAQEHCALMNMGGQYTLYVNEGNACLVNGEPASEEHELFSLEIPAELQLGEGGPRVAMGMAILPPGKAAKAGENNEGAEGEGKEALAPEKPPRAHAPRAPWILAAAALTVAGALLITLLVVARRKPAPVATSRAPQASDESAEQPKEDPYAGLFRRSEGTESSRDPPHAIDPVELEFADAFRAARSVYLVIERIGKTERLRGTAWVAAPGVLATSARAAGAPGKRELFVRSSGRNPVTLRATTIRIHPGFGVLRDMAGTYVPVLVDENGKARELPAGRPCDVALLGVSDAEADRLGAPLTPRSRGAGAATARERVCTVGFASSEGRVVVLERPRASFDVGSVVALSDGFGEPGDAATADLVRHTLPAFAGAAGSPVLNDKGEVVAMLSDGIAYGGQFAVPVAVVTEVVEGRADAAQADRAKRWRNVMRTYKSRLAGLREEVLADWERELGESTARVFRRQEIARVTASQPTRGKPARASVTVDDVGPVLVLVASKRAIVDAGAEQSAVTLKATVAERRDGKTKITHECRPLGSHGLYEYMAFARFRPKGKTELEIAAISDDPGGTQVEVTVYRAVEIERAKAPISQESSASQDAPASTDEATAPSP